MKTEEDNPERERASTAQPLSTGSETAPPGVRTERSDESGPPGDRGPPAFAGRPDRSALSGPPATEGRPDRPAQSGPPRADTYMDKLLGNELKN